MMFFLQEYKRNYKVANFAIVIALIAGIIMMVFNIMNGMYWFVAIRGIILPFTIGLTYFERVQRGKYDFKV